MVLALFILFIILIMTGSAETVVLHDDIKYTGGPLKTDKGIDGFWSPPPGVDF
jgi:hypothetical protein